ncbi:MAG TPA: SIMPL domain-containing protein [Candidatus Cloacimonadota bacterium]|nr:SIMPL domain-containing protein [Candidatus Cloacimonadota bacterium]
MKPIYLLIAALSMCQLLFSEETSKAILFPDHHLCLEATGKVVLKADKAVFSFTVIGYGPSLRDAVTNAKTKVAEVTTALNGIGIPDDNFATGSFTSGKSLSGAFLSDKKDYTAALVTTVSLKDMTKLDEAVLILTDKKVNDLSSISYVLADQASARQQAREIAFNRINQQRDSITRILGVNITDVQLIDEAPFEQLPWNTWNTQYTYDKRNMYSNTVTNYIDNEDKDVQADKTGGFYTPEITVETQVRVIYRIGVK